MTLLDPIANPEGVQWVRRCEELQEQVRLLEMKYKAERALRAGRQDKERGGAGEAEGEAAMMVEEEANKWRAKVARKSQVIQSLIVEVDRLKARAHKAREPQNMSELARKVP